MKMQPMEIKVNIKYSLALKICLALMAKNSRLQAENKALNAALKKEAAHE